jgi:hypothetical protein
LEGLTASPASAVTGRAGAAGWLGRARWLALTAVALAIGWAAWPTAVVEVRDDATGATFARWALDEAAPLRLSYVHSIYRRPGTEEFRVGSLGLTLVRLASPSEAVLEYYARPEPIARAGDEYEVRVGACRGVPTCVGADAARRMTVLASALGRRTLLYAGHELPLYALGASGDRVAIEVGQAPRAALLWPHAS